MNSQNAPLEYDRGVVLPVYFSTQDGLARSKQGTPLDQIVDTLARRGKRHGYFLTDQQATVFGDELLAILEGKYATLQIAQLQRLMQGTPQDTQNKENTFATIHPTAFSTAGSTLHCDLQQVVTILTVAHSIFLEDIATVGDNFRTPRLLLSCETITADAAHEQDIDPSVYAAAVTVLLLGKMFTVSSMVAKQVGAFSSFQSERSVVLEGLRKQRQAISNLKVGILSEELLDTIVSVWDEAVEACSRYGLRSENIALLEIITLQSDDDSISPDQSPLSARTTHAAQHSINSTAYNLDISNEHYTFVVVLSGQRTIQEVLFIPNNFNSNSQDTVVVQQAVEAVSIGLAAGIPLSTYVEKIPQEKMQQFNQLGLAAALTNTDIIPYILWRLGLDFLDADNLVRLELHDPTSDQVSLLEGQNEDDLEHPYPLSDKLCEQCGHKASHVGKYYMCMNCGSAAV